MSGEGGEGVTDLLESCFLLLGEVAGVTGGRELAEGKARAGVSEEEWEEGRVSWSG